MSFTVKDLGPLLKELMPKGFKQSKGPGAFLWTKSNQVLSYRIVFSYSTGFDGLSLRLPSEDISSPIVSELFKDIESTYGINPSFNSKLINTGLLSDNNHEFLKLRDIFSSTTIRSIDQFNTIKPQLIWALENFCYKNIETYHDYKSIADLYLSLPMDDVFRLAAGPHAYFLVPYLLQYIGHPQFQKGLDKFKNDLFEARSEGSKYIKYYEVFCDYFGVERDA